jgi:hypothetical protein
MLQKERILRVVSESPSTTGEVSALTGLPRKHCCAILRYLWQSGVLTREPYKRPGIRGAFLWSLSRPRSTRR